MPGMVVKVGLRSPEEKRSFILPAYIVQLDENNRTFVWVNNGGKAQRRFVTCGDYTAKTFRDLWRLYGAWRDGRIRLGRGG